MDKLFKIEETQLNSRNKKAVQGNRAKLFGSVFTGIHYKFKSSQAPKARLQSFRHTGEKPT